METNFVKLYTGNFLTVQLIVEALEKVGINPIIKDESESARLAGFGTFSQGIQEIHVHEDNLDKATAITETTLNEIEA